MQDRPTRPGRPLLPRTARQATVDRLQQPARREALDFTGLAMVGSIRLLALCVRVGRDPLPELVQRFGGLETTRAFLAFADAVGTCWPDRVQVLRPCCGHLSPDEHTLATLAQHALAGDRAGFYRQIDGFVRADRHDRLFDLAAHMAATIQQCALANPASRHWR